MYYISMYLVDRYMTRRCNFLDTLPAFNYNISRGELVTKEYGVQMYTDTSKLGSTLLSIMLKEVNDFCDPTIKENWSVKPHQQVRIIIVLSLRMMTFTLSAPPVDIFFCSSSMTLRMAALAWDSSPSILTS